MKEPVPTIMRVLLIDDQPMVGEAVRRALAGEPDLDFHYCNDPNVALVRAAEVQPMVILQDLVMPGMDGFQLLEQFRATPYSSEIPIIVLSTTDDPGTKSRAFALGANDYLVKLPDKVELVARVRYHCRAFANQQQLRRTNQQLEAATRAKSEFLAYMSHEIRTPMNGVIGMAELLSETEMSSEQRSYIDILRSSGDALLSIINDVLDFSKIEAGKMHLDSIDFEPRSVIEDVRLMLLPRANIKGLELFSLIQEDVPVVLKGDPGRLRQVVTNLINNSIKFTGKGHVLIAVKSESVEGETVRLRFEISDTGIGISEEQRPRLFEAFSQADASTTRKFGGTGLGLVISKHFVELMQGEIGFDSLPGAGTLFWFTASFGIGERSTVPDSMPRPDLTGIRALLVFDQDDVSGTLLAAAAHAWGMTCDFALANEAITRLRSAAKNHSPYDLLLLDIEINDAIQLGKSVHTEVPGKPPVVVVIALVGYSGYADEAREAGIAVCMPKPVSHDELNQCLRHHLGTVAAAASGPVGHPLKRRPRVLVVDDNEVNRIAAVRMLEKLDIDSDVAANGIQAIEACKRFGYDLVLMDCEMPEMDGFAATGEIRRFEIQNNSRRLPVIAITANAIRGEREKCLNAGMDDYMAKPIRLGPLRDMIAVWSAGFAENAEAPLVSGDPPVDFGVIDEIGGIDTDFATHLIQEFVREAEARVPELEEACRVRDSAAIVRLGHRLRGSCLAVGANGMADVCAQIEQAGRVEDVDRCVLLAPKVDREFIRARAALESHKNG